MTPIWLTDVSGSQLLLNTDSIFYVEENGGGGSKIFSNNGDILNVKESIGEIETKIADIP